MRSTKVIFKGYIQLKRVRFWVMRHLILYEDRFVYTENESDIEIRGEYFLADIDISEITNKNAKLIQVIKKNSEEVLLISNGESHKKLYHRMTLCKQKIAQERGMTQDHSQNNTSASISRIIPATNASSNRNSHNPMEEDQDHWENSRINTNPDFVVKDPTDKRYKYNKGYYIIDKNLAQDSGNNSLVKDGFGLLSLFDTDSKHLVSTSPDFLVYQLGKESPTKQGMTKKLKKGFLLLKDVVFEQFIWKTISLLGIYTLFYFSLMIPFYTSFIAFYVLFFKGKIYQILHRIQQNDYDFYTYGYFKSNINEFLKYIKSKSDLQSSAIYKDKKIFLQVKDKVKKVNFTIVCFLSIFDYDGFTVHTICRGSKKSFNSTLQFFEQAKEDIGFMRKDSTSILSQYYNTHKDTIFDSIHTSTKYAVNEEKVSIIQAQKQQTQVNNQGQAERTVNLQKSQQQQQQQQQVNQEQDDPLNKKNKYPQLQQPNNQQSNSVGKIDENVQEIVPKESSEPVLNEQQQAYKNQLLALSNEMVSLSQLNAANNWELIDKDKHIVVHRKFNEAKGLVYCRGECKIPVGAKELEEFLYNIQNQKHYNSYFDYGEDFEKITEDIKIMYSSTKKIAIVSPRDVLALQGIVRKDNDVLICCQSIYDKVRAPHKKDAVRVDLFIGGFMLQPISPNETNCVYVVCSDPKGKIPQWIKNMGMKDQAYTPNLIRKYYEKKNGGK